MNDPDKTPIVAIAPRKPSRASTLAMNQTLRALSTAISRPTGEVYEELTASTRPPLWPPTVRYPVYDLNQLSNEELRLVVRYLRRAKLTKERHEADRFFAALDGSLADLERECRLARRHLTVLRDVLTWGERHEDGDAL
jgi:hypothetical protein